MKFCFLIGLLLSVPLLLLGGQTTSVPHVIVRKEQVQEAERYLANVEGEDRSVNYMAYVVLPVLGLIGCLMVVRRFVFV